MSRHKRHDDEELLKRLKREAPHILDAETDFDEAFKALISVDSDRVGLTPKRRRSASKDQKIKKRITAKRGKK